MGFGQKADYLSADFKVKEAEWANVLEQTLEGDEGKCEVTESQGAWSVALDMRSFEIRTLRLVVE